MDVGSGCRELFEQIYVQTKEMIYNYITVKCYAIDDIDDIFQNTFVAVYDALCRRSEPPDSSEAFVMLICKRQLAKYYSAARRFRERFAPKAFADESAEPEESFSIEDDVADKLAAEEIAGYIASKPLAVQKAFFLHYRRGLTFAETAIALGVSESAVKAYIYRTLSEIRRRYGRDS